MKHQQVSVDYWAMGKAMVTYGALTALVWMMLRLMAAVFTLPRRLRAQQETCEARLRELQRRFPDLNITEEDLKNAEKELEELTREDSLYDSKPKAVEDVQNKNEKPGNSDTNSETEESKPNI